MLGAVAGLVAVPPSPAAEARGEQHSWNQAGRRRGSVDAGWTCPPEQRCLHAITYYQPVVYDDKPYQPVVHDDRSAAGNGGLHHVVGE